MVHGRNAHIGVQASPPVMHRNTREHEQPWRRVRHETHAWLGSSARHLGCCTMADTPTLQSHEPHQLMGRKRVRFSRCRIVGS